MSLLLWQLVELPQGYKVLIYNIPRIALFMNTPSVSRSAYKTDLADCAPLASPPPPLPCVCDEMREGIRRKVGFLLIPPPPPPPDEICLSANGSSLSMYRVYLVNSPLGASQKIST